LKLRPTVAILLAVAGASVLATPRTIGAQRTLVTPVTTAPQAARSPMRILLVDDDWSDNNNNLSDSRRSPSDLAFRRLVSDAVARDTSAMAIDVVKLYANGPDIERLRAFSLIVWYTGASYGGNADNASVLSIVDEKTVRRYLEETGGTVILVSPGYVNKVLGANSTWDRATWPFLNEVLGIKGGKGLAQRFQPGTVIARDGTKFTVGKGTGAVETQFSAVNPDGASVVFTSALTAKEIGTQPAPVATVSSFGRGRIVYVGFTLENLDAADLAPAFQALVAAGRPTAATEAVAEPPTAISTVSSTQPRSRAVDRTTPSPTIEPAATPAATLFQSGLLGIAMPAGTTISNSGLYRAAARASLKLDAEPAGMKLGDALEVLRIPLTAPPRAELVALIRSGGWTLNMNQSNPTWGIAEKAGVALMVEFIDSKRDRWLYVAAIAERGPGRAVAVSGATPAPAPRSAPETAASPTTPPPTAEIATPSQPTAPVPTQRTAGTGGGFQFTVSDFDDGWTATERPDHVEVTKGPITTLLFFGVQMTDQMRSNTSEYFWARDVTPRFDVQTVARRQDARSVYRTEYLEGDATERSTGRRVFIGMNVHSENGRARNIVVIAPDEATFHQLFPQPNDLERMMPYNRFSVAASDLTGHWSSSGSVVTQMYFRSTGESAGSNINSSNADFFVNADGSYTSRHVGAFGMSGNTKAFSDTYTGQFTMNGGWEVTFTNRFKGNPDTFEAWFEIVQGGRVLHLVNVKATGIRYNLGREP